jgi:hypothetical protein
MSQQKTHAEILQAQCLSLGELYQSAKAILNENTRLTTSLASCTRELDEEWKKLAELQAAGTIVGEQITLSKETIQKLIDLGDRFLDRDFDAFTDRVIFPGTAEEYHRKYNPQEYELIQALQQRMHK